MHTTNRYRAFALAFALAAASASCGQETLVRVDRPPIVGAFSPADTVLDAFVGDTLRFSISVTDPDQDVVEVTFLLGDSAVASASNWRYAVVGEGVVPVRCTVSDGEYRSQLTWWVRQIKPVNLPPRLTGSFPVELNPTMVVDTDLLFAVDAFDPEGDTLSFEYSVNTVPVARGARFTYHPTVKATDRVRATISDGENEVFRDWLVRVTGIPDTVPPAVVTLTDIRAGSNPGDVDLEWVAVGKDGMVGVPSNYLVRTSPTEIRFEADWVRASERPGAPPPAQPGTVMRMTVRDITPARHTYVAVRAVDDFGNLSPIGVSTGTFSRGMRIGGVVLDAVTNLPIAGTHVRFLGVEDTTSADGRWELTELPPETGTLLVIDEDDRGRIGGYFDYASLYSTSHLDDLTLYMLPAVSLESTLYGNFLVFFRAMTDTPGIPVGSAQRRWQLPVDLYVPQYSKGGLDYAAVISAVAGELDADVGEPVFTLVPAPPSVGIQVFYVDNLSRDNWLMQFWTADWFPQNGRIQHRTVYTASSVQALRNVSRHELGHALGLNHSVDSRHVMVGAEAPSRPTFSPDEVAVLRARYHLPRGFDNAGFRED